MNLIVVVDKNWAIGRDNDLIYSVPKDMEFFRNTTMGNVVVMGGNTFRSLPPGGLKGRTNIVLSRSGNINDDNVIVCSTLPALFEELKNYSKGSIFICGGEDIYRTMLDYCDTAYITKIDAETDGADNFFPNLDELDNWEVSTVSDEYITNGYKIKFYKYINSAVNLGMENI